MDIVSLIAKATIMVLEVLWYAIFAVVLMSWIPQARESKFGEILRMLTDPILLPIRAFTNKILGGRAAMFDFSPLFAIILINILEKVIQGFVKK